LKEISYGEYLGRRERKRDRERERDVVMKYNEEFYRKFKGLALTSTHHKLPDMYEDFLLSV